MRGYGDSPRATGARPDEEDPVDESTPRHQLLGATVHAELVDRGQTLATAESITGGALADLLTAAPGASEVFLGGVVTYATELKVALLGVGEDVVEQHGVVSAPCAAAMAEGVRDRAGSDWGLSTTGVAGPATQEDKPVGLVYVGVAGPEGTTTHELHLDGDRAQIRTAACEEAAVALVRALGVGDPAAEDGAGGG